MGKKWETRIVDGAKKSVFLMIVLYVIAWLFSLAGFASILVSFNFTENILGYFLTFLVGFVGLDYVKTEHGLPIRAKGYTKTAVEAVMFLVLLYVFGILFSMIGLQKFFVTLGIASNILGYAITFIVGFIGLEWLEKQL
ncbi:MAG: hypothetical protein ACTSV7_14875 [Candidatus Baldrarchaeia archaeon]